jgi:hypothetical protein
MANYMLFLYHDPSGWNKFSPAEMQKVVEQYLAWGQKAREGGFFRYGHRLAEHAGKVVRGEKVSDGPYGAGREVLGGYYLIAADNYHQAVQRAQDHPHVKYGGTIEVREVHSMHDQV